VVSSAVAGEGKTEVVANLGLALAQSGDRVMVLDANLRSPGLGERLGMRSGIGLTEVLEGRESIEGVLHRHRTEPLAVLTSGSPRPNPSELLDSEQFDAMLGALAESFDFIIVDTPALLSNADAAVVARRASGVILVARAASTSRDEFQAARQGLRAVDGRMLGVVLNRARERDRWLYREDPPAPPRPVRAHSVG
jgi:capsular exopolysaccharide synthesis family protein